MPNRRQFFRTMAGATAGVLGLGSAFEGVCAQTAPLRAGVRRQVVVGGQRARVVDFHAHTTVPEVTAFLKNTPLARPTTTTGAAKFAKLLDLGPERLRFMDEQGIDMQVLSIGAFWYGAERELAKDLISLQNEKLAAMCKAANPDRFVGLATLALQYPELAAEQLEEGVKRFGLKGGSIGGRVAGDEMAHPRFDPFWAKAEALGVPIFMHPSSPPEISRRLEGNGPLTFLVGIPFDSSVFLTRLIFEGTFDRFPGLKLCVAHGGGYLASYGDRSDHGCDVYPEDCKKLLKKKPSEYLKQVYYDSIIFTPEAMRHLVAQTGASQIVIGTDYPYPWSPDYIDHVLKTPNLSAADQRAILGGNALKLLGLPG